MELKKKKQKTVGVLIIKCKTLERNLYTAYLGNYDKVNITADLIMVIILIFVYFSVLLFFLEIHLPFTQRYWSSGYVLGNLFFIVHTLQGYLRCRWEVGSLPSWVGVLCSHRRLWL